jgi:hypothetical protein
MKGCQKIMPDIPRHFRDVHSFSRWESTNDSMAGTKISQLDWTVPEESLEREEFRDPYPASAEKRRVADQQRLIDEGLFSVQIYP